MTRRTFLERITETFSLVIGVMLALPVFHFLRASFQEEKDEEWVPLLDLSSGPLIEEVTQVRFQKVLRDGWMVRVVEENVWVRKMDENRYQVFSPRCTHLGCRVSWNPQVGEFHCPCHGGKFNRDGKNIAGPPSRPLDQYETRFQNRRLEIKV